MKKKYLLYQEIPNFNYYETKNVEAWLCGSELAQFFDLEKKPTVIELHISDRKPKHNQAYRIKRQISLRTRRKCNMVAPMVALNVLLSNGSKKTIVIDGDTGEWFLGKFDADKAEPYYWVWLKA